MPLRGGAGVELVREGVRVCAYFQVDLGEMGARLAGIRLGAGSPGVFRSISGSGRCGSFRFGHFVSVLCGFEPFRPGSSFISGLTARCCCCHELCWLAEKGHVAPPETPPPRRCVTRHETICHLLLTVFRSSPPSSLFFVFLIGQF